MRAPSNIAATESARRPILEQMGFGVGVALLVDATIVRTVLVPASMKLLGRHNWYLPSWLNWIPDIHVEGHTAAKPAATKPSKNTAPVPTT
jgi:uncharacterized membrane protein YdfJ with MMPL/SSD domain